MYLPTILDLTLGDILNLNHFNNTIKEEMDLLLPSKPFPLNILDI